MKRKIVYQWLSLISIMALSLSCTRSSSPYKSNHKNLNGSIAKLLSTRSEKTGPAKVIIRLPADPLAKVPKEEWIDQLTLIQDQHKIFTDQLAAISSEIKIIYTYKTILNGMYVIIPENQVGKVDEIIPAGSHVELSTAIRPPETMHAMTTPTTVNATASGKHGDVKAKNSVKFIGADILHAQGIKGQGIKVGIIDTGIDYTHSMLGGTGSAEDYKKIAPDQASPFFPNNKVVGGYDFVGTKYDSASPDVLLRIPKPDPNPLDEAGHGTHVAGTVAGIGDGVNSYDGVAPEAQLYALKVFGAEGSTDDAIVIAALEFAADPDENIETKNHLDVVNLSLGSPFGNPKLLYREAIANLNTLGTVVVASAGNSGNIKYITGSPAVSDDAFSIAASIDDMDHNWHFPTAAFKLSADNIVTSEISEATFTKQLETIETMTGKLVYVGLAKEITPEQAALVKGNIALADRGGEVPFATKIKNSFAAGATAVIIINNVEGTPLAMGGSNEEIAIPAIMITLATGKSIKEVINQGTDVIANLKSEVTVAKPELIDTLTDFSSRGPRSEDSIIKPEVAAPGANIVSAKVGGGSEIVPMSGTSMSAPHMAGVMALLKQTHPTLLPQELKSLPMLTAKAIKDSKGVTYPVALQGAGRVRVDAANSAGITMVPAAISLGRNEIMVAKTISKKVKVKNLESQDVTLNIEPKLNADLVLVSPKIISLKANEEKVVDIQIKIKSPNTKTFDNELDGFLQLVDQNKKSYSIPVLAMVLKISQLSSSALKVHSTSDNDSTGSLTQLELKNNSPHAGLAYLFNLLDFDPIKDDTGLNKRGLSTACDVESVGYRTVVAESKGQKVELLQMALKLYNPLTSWSNCEFSVQIDANNDGVADQELAGANRSNTEGLGAGMASLLLDANKARSIRKQYETKLALHTVPAPVLNFSEAVESMMEVGIVNQSSLMIIQAPIANLKNLPGQNLRVKVGALSLEEGLESNDFLGDEWMDMPLNAQAQSLSDIPVSIVVPSQGSVNVSLTKGEGTSPLIIYYPHNHASMTSVGDKQSEIIPLEYVGAE